MSPFARAAAGLLAMAMLAPGFGERAFSGNAGIRQETETETPVPGPGGNSPPVMWVRDKKFGAAVQDHFAHRIHKHQPKYLWLYFLVLDADMDGLEFETRSTLDGDIKVLKHEAGRLEIQFETLAEYGDVGYHEFALTVRDDGEPPNEVARAVPFSVNLLPNYAPHIQMGPIRNIQRHEGPDGETRYSTESGNTIELHIEIKDREDDPIAYRIETDFEFRQSEEKWYPVNLGPGQYDHVVFDLTIPTSNGMIGTNRIAFHYSDDGAPPISETAAFEFTVTPVRDEIVVGDSAGGRNRTIHLLDYPDVDRVSYYASQRTLDDMEAAFTGGGDERQTYLAGGFFDSDGIKDLAVTYGPITAEAPYPNIVNMYSGGRYWFGPLGRNYHTFQAFPAGGTLPVHYNGGELRAAIGRFMDRGRNQIAIAQGVGGNQVVRLFEPTGEARPNGWAVVGQFYGLAAGARDNNAGGGLTLAAGDLDGDGLDELVAGQTNGPTSESQFHVIDVSPEGEVGGRHPYAAFTPEYRGDGGVELAVADLNGDGRKEIVAASKGNGRTRPGERGSAPLNWISIIQPIVEGNAIAGFRRPPGGFLRVWDEEFNPSGALGIAAGELDGDAANGDELVIATGALRRVDGLNVTLEKAAPVPGVRVIKVRFDGTAVDGFGALYEEDGPIGPFETRFGGALYPAALNLNLAR